MIHIKNKKINHTKWNPHVFKNDSTTQTSIVRAEVKSPSKKKMALTWLTELVSQIGMQICPSLPYLDMP